MMGALDWLARKLNSKQQENSSHPSLPTGVTTATQNKPQFFGPQDGLAAELFEAGFRGAFQALPSVQKAYFCKIRYGNEDANQAALCLVNAIGPSLQVIEALAIVIRRHLDQSYHIDILFLSEQQEIEIAKTCPPFYIALLPV